MRCHRLVSPADDFGVRFGYIKRSRYYANTVYSLLDHLNNNSKNYIDNKNIFVALIFELSIYLRKTI
jgi:hypothetical protein